MNEQSLLRLRPLITALVTLSIWVLLAWEHFHGGVASHHLLARADMPAISNWWGGLLLPALTWFLLGRIHRRTAAQHEDGSAETSRNRRSALIGFATALIYGILLATLFTLDYSAVTSTMFKGLLLLALFLPIYRAECVLGFVFGMTVTFGAVLPTLVGSFVALVAAVLFRYVRPVLLTIGSWVLRGLTAAAGRSPAP